MPAYADIQQTKKALGYTNAYHRWVRFGSDRSKGCDCFAVELTLLCILFRIILTQAPGVMERFPVNFALDGETLEVGRCVRANMPFPTTLHVAVYKHNLTNEDIAKGDLRPVFQVDVIRGGYFELSLSERQHRHARSHPMFDQYAMTSIGLVNSEFSLVGKQLGWTRRSFGYHGGEGRFYHDTAFKVSGANCKWCMHMTNS